MWNTPTKERLDNIPRLYETEHEPLREKLVHLHFFIGGSDWFVCEHDGQDLFFGFAILNNDYEMAEWGYVSFWELRSIKVNGWLEVDCETEDTWRVCKAAEIEKIRFAQNWLPENDNQGRCAKENELILKVKAGHFTEFQDLVAEVTSTYSNFFGIDPYPIWKEAKNG